jgi:hypothetical protein
MSAWWELRSSFQRASPSSTALAVEPTMFGEHDRGEHAVGLHVLPGPLLPHPHQKTLDLPQDGIGVA